MIHIYRCLSVIIYNDTELFSDLIIYAKSQDPSQQRQIFYLLTLWLRQVQGPLHLIMEM